MSRILVVGGTGLAGRTVVAEAVKRGHDVIVASRRVPDDEHAAYVAGATYAPADLVTTEGLEEVLDGARVLIDTSNGSGRASAHVFTAGAANLLHTAARFGVRRAVLLSIVNVDRSTFAYYRAKAAQEEIYRASPLATRIVRTTQFHDFVTGFFRRGARAGVIPAFKGVRFQPIAVTDVARVLVDAAEGEGAPGSTRTIGGPLVHTAHDLAAQWKAATGAHGLVVPLSFPGPLAAAWRAGDNLVPEHAVEGITYRDWLTPPA